MAAKYPEIKKYILEQIDNGKFKEDVMLPSEKEFTELFNVSRMTVRRAFDDLIQDGVFSDVLQISRQVKLWRKVKSIKSPSIH